MANTPEFNPPYEARHLATYNSGLILAYANVTSRSLLATFRAVRHARGAKGTPTDEEQDLLRAMVVFAGAGLDSMTKQLVGDALPVLVTELPTARDRIEELVSRHLRQTGIVEADEEEIGTTTGVNPRRLEQECCLRMTRVPP